MTVRVEVDPVLLVYAFRYALGRQTGAPHDVAQALIEHSDVLNDHDRDQIADEIIDAMTRGRAGGQPDVSAWWRVLMAFGRAS